MAYVQKNTSKKTGAVINYKWTALLGRDENGKQVRITKRVEPLGMTPAAELKQMQRNADDWEKEARAEYEKKRGLSAEEMLKARKLKEQITLSSFIDNNWLPQHVKNGTHTPASISFYTHMSDDIKEYFDAAAPGIKLSEVDKSDVLNYLTYLRTSCRGKSGKPYGATSIQHHFSTLRNILSFAEYTDFIKENACKKIKPEDRPKRDDHEIEFLDEEQAIKFLNALDSDEEKTYWTENHSSPLFWKTMVNVLIVTGLRRGELVGLQWGDLDRKQKMLHVRRNVTIDTTHKESKNPDDKIHIGTTKGKMIRRVAISQYLLELLDAYKAEQEEKIGGLLLPSGYIFCRAGNFYAPMYPTEPTRLMRKIIKRHNLPDISPHDLRHTAGYLAIESGSNVKEIQALLGHKDPAVTMKFYVGIVDKGQHRTVEGIESILRPKQTKKPANGQG